MSVGEVDASLGEVAASCLAGPHAGSCPIRKKVRVVQDSKPVTTSPTLAPINPIVRAAAPAQSRAIAPFGRVGLLPITDTKNPVGIRTAATKMPSVIAGYRGIRCAHMVDLL